MPSARSMRKSSVHPRVGGEHDLMYFEHARHTGSSPRGRGTPQPEPRPPCGIRFIPEWAGNTVEQRERRIRPPVHPRVGGEHHVT